MRHLTWILSIVTALIYIFLFMIFNEKTYMVIAMIFNCTAILINHIDNRFNELEGREE